jgi:hypothetical protein
VGQGDTVSELVSDKVSLFSFFFYMEIAFAAHKLDYTLLNLAVTRGSGHTKGDPRCLVANLSLSQKLIMPSADWTLGGKYCTADGFTPPNSIERLDSDGGSRARSLSSSFPNEVQKNDLKPRGRSPKTELGHLSAL